MIWSFTWLAEVMLMLSMSMMNASHKIASALVGRQLSAAHAAGKPKLSGEEISRAKRTAKAKAAAVSVTGSGTGGGSPHTKSSGSLREQLSDSWDSRHGR